MNAELNVEGQRLFSNIVSKSKELRTYMKQLYPYLITTFILTGDETYDELNNDYAVKQFLSKNLANFLSPKPMKESTYGQNLISEFDLYHSCKTNDDLQV
jgi:hypothetical protein